MLKFYAVEQGRHDDWQIHFVLATSPEDAAERYIKSVKFRYAMWLQSDHYHGRTVEARIYETKFDDFGVLQRLLDLPENCPILSIQVPD